MKKRNKAFTLVELIIVIAILAVIMLIGTVAYAGIRERMEVRADKATAGQIGKSLAVREVDLPKEDGVPLYPEIIKYDDLDKVENYVAKDIKPKSMKDGFFYATSFQTQNGKKIVVGIGKEGDEFKDKIYKNKKDAGWAWSEDVEISEFIEENRDKITGEETGNEGSGGSLGGNPSEEPEDEEATVGIKPITALRPGDYVQYKFPSSYTATALGKNTGKGTYDEGTGEWTWDNQYFIPSSYSSGWRVLYNNSGKLDIISAQSIGNLTLGTKYSGLSSETDPKLTGGKIGYAKAIETLNDLCNQYSEGLNKSENEGGVEIAESGRAPGQGTGVSNILEVITDSNGDGYVDVDLNKDGKVDVDDITNTNISTVVSSIGDDVIYLPYGDMYDDMDNDADPEISEVKRIATYTPHSSGEVWIASRSLRSSPTSSSFRVRRMSYNGNVDNFNLYRRYSGVTSYAIAGSYGVRPIITLKSGLKVIDGEGTADKPYVLSF